MVSFIDYHGIRMSTKSNRRVLVIGATGFIGSRLTERLWKGGYLPTALLRRGEKPGPAAVACIEGDPAKPGPWQSEVRKYDAVINLAGSSIFRRWTAKAKREILESRLSSTRNVVDAILASGRSIHLLNASGVGYYGFHDDEELDEGDGAGRNFIAGLAQQWEDEARRASAGGSRVVLCRFGIVLGRGGGAMEKMTKAVRWGVGARLGSGRQWFSWIHEEDLARAFLFLLGHEGIVGPVNFTSPYPIRNAELMEAMRKVMGRRAIIPSVPPVLLRLIYLEFSTVFLKGQRVRPGILSGNGFQFRFPHIKLAIGDLVSQGPSSCSFLWTMASHDSSVHSCR